MRKATLILVLLAGCAGTEVEESTVSQVSQELPEPALRMVSPTAIRAGEPVTIFGRGFVDKSVGETRLFFQGTYMSSSGNSTPVKLEVTPTYVNQGVLSWSFGPNVPFVSEPDTGWFRGIVFVFNVSKVGEAKRAAQPIGVELRVLPSIVIRQLRPVETACDVGLTDTIDNTKMMFEVSTIGMKAGTEIAPLRFVYTFMKENFQFSGSISGAMGLDPEALFPKSGPVSVVDDVRDGAVSSLGGAPRNVYVYKGGQTSSMAGLVNKVENLFGLSHLITTQLPETANYADAYMNITAIDSTGEQTTRSIKLRVWTPVEVQNKGAVRTVRSFDPVPVSGCIPGGDIGRDVSYAESTSETRSRTFRISASATGEVNGGINAGIGSPATGMIGANFGMRLSATFGFGVDDSVSSSESKDLRISVKLLPGEFGAFYRQTLQLERTAELIGHGACGGSQVVGQAIITDWVWGPDMGKATTCPPLPKSNLAPGQTF